MNYFRCGGGRSTHTATKIDVAKTPLASFEGNVSGLYLPEILAYIQATQAGSGDPSPINPRTINGVSEVTTACNAVNQWDEQWELGVYNTANGNPQSNNTQIRSKNTFPILPNTTYFAHIPIGSIWAFFYDKNDSLINTPISNITQSGYAYGVGNKSFTTPTNAVKCKFYCTAAYGATYNNDISINHPSTDTAYHAYTGTTATTALGGTYYGGYLNVPTGLLTVTHATATYDHTADWSNVGGAYPFAFQLQTTLTNVAGSPVATQNGNMCNIFPWSTELVPSTNAIRFSETNTNPKVYIYDYDHTSDLTGFKAMLEQTPLQICYKLKTPQTIQLTPAQLEQLLGQNNVFCSTGDVAVKYWKID